MTRLVRTIALATTVAAVTVAGAQATPGAAPDAVRISAPVAVKLLAPSCKRGYYRNASGHCVRRPSHDPRGATAQCRDGTYSYSQHASGTCSHHHGVRRWIHHP